jgi:hypothetical protein
MANVLQIPIKGAGCGVVIPLTLTAGVVSVPTTPDKYKFDNLAPGSILKLPAPDSGSSSSDSYLTWDRTDQGQIRYKINQIVIEGSSGLEASATASGGSNTAPSIILVTNNIPISTEITDHKTFITAMELMKTKPGLVCLPLGQGYSPVSMADIGFALLWGRNVSEGNYGADGKAAQTFTFEFKAEAYDCAAGDVTTLTAALFLPAITPLLGNAVTFPQITSTAIDALKAGGFYIL